LSVAALAAVARKPANIATLIIRDMAGFSLLRTEA
jgi:hypothetical protein